MGSREVPFEKDKKCGVCGDMGAHDFMGDYLCDECIDYTEPDDVIPKVGVDAFNELAESHESHVRQVKKLEEELDYYKQLDYEGISVSADKGKIAHVEKPFGSIIMDDVLLKLIKWIQETQSEMDLQTKTPKEILGEYGDKR